MKKTTGFLLSILSGILLSLPWYQNFSGLIATVGFIPLLLIEDHLYQLKDKNHYFDINKFSFVAFLIWNIISTYWIKNSDLTAAIVVIFLNTFFMSLTFMLFHITKRTFGNKIGSFSLIVYWISFEYIFLHAHLTWPWLNLGNCFAGNIKLIQWYEYTGVLGGTLWILLLNLSLFKVLKLLVSHQKSSLLLPNIIFFIILLIIPILFSKTIFNNFQETGKEIKIALIQPNFDPYSEKYHIAQEQQITTILYLADSIFDKNVNYVVAPETAINKPVWEHKLKSDTSILRIKHFVNKHPQTTFIIGASTFKKLDVNEERTPTTKFHIKDSCYYIAYNAALQIDTSSQIPMYYKSKLVSGVETMPFLKLFHFFEKFILDFGGVKGSLGIQEERDVFTKADISIAPVICYESAFGQHVGDYIKKGANLIFIITNDGWWGDTPGYKQHLSYAQLRAIETRRSIARSANTGISAFINQKGEITKETQWWVSDAIKQNLKTNHKITFYVRHGDYLGRTALFLFVFLFLYTLVKNLIRKSL